MNFHLFQMICRGNLTCSWAQCSGILIKIFLVCHLISVSPFIIVSYVHRGSSGVLLKVYYLLIFMSFHLRQNRFCFRLGLIPVAWMYTVWIYTSCLNCTLLFMLSLKRASKVDEVCFPYHSDFYEGFTESNALHFFLSTRV